MCSLRRRNEGFPKHCAAMNCSSEPPWGYPFHVWSSFCFPIKGLPSPRASLNGKKKAAKINEIRWIFSCILFINHGLVFLVELDKLDHHHQQQRHHHRLLSACTHTRTPPQSTSMSIPFSYCSFSSSTKPCDVQRSTCFIAAIVFANDELSLLRTYVNRLTVPILREINSYVNPLYIHIVQFVWVISWLTSPC